MERSQAGSLAGRLIALGAVIAAPAAAQVVELRSFDRRIELNQGFSVAPSPVQRAGASRLRASGVDGVAVTYDSVTGVARSLSSHTGQLTAGSAGLRAEDHALDFVRDNLDLLGLVPADLDDYEVTDTVVSRVSRSTHLYLRQRALGLPLYNGQLQINLDRDGRILSVNNAFLPSLAQSVNTTRPVIAAAEARAAAARQIGLDLDAAPQPSPGEPRLMLLPIRRGQARLVWNLQLRTAGSRHHFDFTVDAVTGEVWTRFDWVASDQYQVYPQPVESPQHTTPAPPADGRVLVVDPADATASPFGWHDTNGVAGAEFLNLRGNNVHAYEDSDANDAPPVSEPSCGATLNCSFAIDLTQAPSSYIPAAVANLFYWNNVVHDVQYQYGFDEAGGNFQLNNYGNGGSGGDPVQAEAQDGSDFNNANFGTFPDGFPPRMQMFLFTLTTPNRDGDLDAGIVVHEYGHGISNRLVGGPSNVGCLLNAQQPGEGLSDWWSLVYTHELGDAGTNPRGMGTYALGQPTTGSGIRTQRYSTDPAVNTHTYESIDGMAIPHGVGEVWAQAAWEAYWALVDEHGFDPDLYDATGTAGNQRAMLYVNEGLQNTICSPAFTDVRDGIIQAAAANHGGEDVCLLWEAFAAFGLGADAVSGGPNSTTPTNGFGVPPACQADFTMVVTPPDLGVCTPSDGVYGVDLGVNGAANPATLSVGGVPAGATAGFSVNPVTPPGSSLLTIGNTGAAAPGSYTLTVTGTNASGQRVADVGLGLFSVVPGIPGLVSPADGATDVALLPALQWSASSQAGSYFVEVATDAGFGSVVASGTVSGTTFTPASELSSSTDYFWRVTASNACGSGSTSAVFDFTTGAFADVECATSGSNCTAAIPDADLNGVDSTITVPGGLCPAIVDLGVRLQATHGWIGDVAATVTHDGTATSAIVFDQPGLPAAPPFGCPSSDLDVILDDEATGGAVEDQCNGSGAFPTSPPSFTPNSPLSVFDGIDPQGTWTLNVRDLAFDFAGSLDGWTLQLTCPAAGAIFEDGFESGDTSAWSATVP